MLLVGLVFWPLLCDQLYVVRRFFIVRVVLLSLWIPWAAPKFYHLLENSLSKLLSCNVWFQILASRIRDPACKPYCLPHDPL
ncbi:hypothetical protein V8E51_000661 [Hyaloscypha variabilis]